MVVKGNVVEFGRDDALELWFSETTFANSTNQRQNASEFWHFRCGFHATSVSNWNPTLGAKVLSASSTVDVAKKDPDKFMLEQNRF